MEKPMLKKILVVDDSELIHNMYKLMMKKYAGCKLVKALNGKEALDQLAQENDFDLILLDINMPVMNGIQFLETLRKEKKLPSIPIIIISTEGKEEDTVRGLGLGARGYVVKPFQSMTLHALIEKIMEKKAGVVC
jgi:two-component system chemotaxis response regulator CheY